MPERIRIDWVDLGTVSLIVTAAGVVVPLLLYWAVRDTRLRFLFKRPGWAHIDRETTVELAPAQ